ncbi:MAG: hypothetical protein R2838_05265 [Caldilineaceae bacterium]
MRDKFMDAAIEEAQGGLAEGGIPIGSVLVIDGEIVGRGHNRRRRGAPSSTRRWMHWRTPVGWRPRTISALTLYFYPFAVRHVQRHALLLQDSQDRHRRKNKTFQGPERTCAPEAWTW